MSSKPHCWSTICIWQNSSIFITFSFIFYLCFFFFNYFDPCSFTKVVWPYCIFLPSSCQAFEYYYQAITASNSYRAQNSCHRASWCFLGFCFCFCCLLVALQVLFAAVLMLMMMPVGRRCFELTSNCANAVAATAMLCHGSFSVSCNTLSSSFDMSLWLCDYGGAIVMLWTDCWCIICILRFVFPMRIHANLRIIHDCWLHGPDQLARR